MVRCSGHNSARPTANYVQMSQPQEDGCLRATTTAHGQPLPLCKQCPLQTAHNLWSHGLGWDRHGGSCGAVEAVRCRRQQQQSCWSKVGGLACLCDLCALSGPLVLSSARILISRPCAGQTCLRGVVILYLLRFSWRATQATAAALLVKGRGLVCFSDLSTSHSLIGGEKRALWGPLALFSARNIIMLVTYTQGACRAAGNGICLLHCTPPPPCISYALVQATVGVGTVLIWDLILARYQT